METFGQRLRQLRLNRKLSQQGLANLASQHLDKKPISRISISQWESGTTKEILAINLFKIAAVLGMGALELFAGKTNLISVEDGMIKLETLGGTAKILAIDESADIETALAYCSGESLLDTAIKAGVAESVQTERHETRPSTACVECNGSGKIMVVKGVNIYAKGRDESCPDCRGTGLLLGALAQ